MSTGALKNITVFGVSFPSKRFFMRALGYKFCPSFKDEKEIENWLMERYGIDDSAYIAELLKDLKRKYSKFLLERRFEHRRKD